MAAGNSRRGEAAAGESANARADQTGLFFFRSHRATDGHTGDRHAE